MIRTHVLRANINRQLADSLNHESGRIYSAVMVVHWRAWRKKGVWIRNRSAEKLNDLYDSYREESRLLHAHSTDAAQQAFYKACKTIKMVKQMGNREARYPWRRKRFRTTIWKNTGIRLREGNLLLSLARGREPVRIKLDVQLSGLDQSAFKEAKLVFNHNSKKYDWHLVVDDGLEPPERNEWTNVAAVDLGEIHPAVVSDQTQAVVFSARELRATVQYRNKRLAGLSQRQSKLKKKSRLWWRLQRRKDEVRRHGERKTRDIAHKVSRAIVDWAVERQVRTVVIGDV